MFYSLQLSQEDNTAKTYAQIPTISFEVNHAQWILRFSPLFSVFSVLSLFLKNL